jgi:hypothetical protein
MKYYDSKKIGKLISAGSEHIILEYGDDKVIKFSIVNYLIGRKNGLDRATHELHLCKKYFGKYILETEILISKNHRFVVEIQPKIKQRFLTINDMQNPSIRVQFLDIIQKYQDLVTKENIEFDFTGQAGLFKQRLSNIFIIDNNKLKIIDATLLNVARPFWLRAFLVLIRLILLPIQKSRISRFINY